MPHPPEPSPPAEPCARYRRRCLLAVQGCVPGATGSLRLQGLAPRERTLSQTAVAGALCPLLSWASHSRSIAIVIPVPRGEPRGSSAPPSRGLRCLSSRQRHRRATHPKMRHARSRPTALPRRRDSLPPNTSEPAFVRPASARQPTDSNTTPAAPVARTGLGCPKPAAGAASPRTSPSVAKGSKRHVDIWTSRPYPPSRRGHHATGRAGR